MSIHEEIDENSVILFRKNIFCGLRHKQVSVLKDVFNPHVYTEFSLDFQIFEVCNLITQDRRLILKVRFNPSHLTHFFQPSLLFGQLISKNTLFTLFHDEPVLHRLYRVRLRQVRIRVQIYDEFTKGLVSNC